MMDHLLTRARRGSIADMQLCGPPRWLTKSEAIAVERIRPGQHPGHAIELQIWHPTATKTSRKETIPVIHEPRTMNPTHVPSSRCRRCRPQSASAPGLPPKLHAGAGANAVAQRSPRTQVHHEDATAAAPSLLEQSGFQIHPKSGSSRWGRI